MANNKTGRANKVGGVTRPVAMNPLKCGGHLKAKGGKLKTKKSCKCK